MKKCYKYVILFTLFCSVMFAQKRILIDGRAKVYKSEAQVIYLKNLTTAEQTQSDLTGYFSIPVQEGDELSFWSVNIKTETIKITPEIMDAKKVEVMLLKNNQRLEEIVIDTKGNQVDPLGLKMKKYSQAERQYRAESYFPLSFTSLGLGPLINVFNGKRKMQRKMIDYEKDDVNFQYFKRFYTTDYLMKRLNMPKEYVDAFVYFVVSHPNFNIVEWSDKEGKDLDLANMAVQFKEENKLKY